MGKVKCRKCDKKKDEYEIYGCGWCGSGFHCFKCAEQDFILYKVGNGDTGFCCKDCKDDAGVEDKDIIWSNENM